MIRDIVMLSLPGVPQFLGSSSSFPRESTGEAIERLCVRRRLWEILAPVQRSSLR